MNIIKKFIRVVGPGVITGAADNDPSGIGTYSQTGAQFGFGQLWTPAYIFPLLVSIQEACARIGAVSGLGIATLIKKHYSKKLLYPIILLFLVATIINIGADIGAMAEATRLIVPVNFYVLIFSFTLIMVLLQIFVPYKKYANILKWLCLSLLAYPISIFIIKVPWLTLLKATFVPHLEFNFQFLFIITGVLGTTISPYLFFWEAAEEVEEKREAHLIKHDGKSHISWRYMKNLRLDNFMGMLFTEIVFWSIVVVTASVLHTHGIKDIKTAADAAKALESLVQTFPSAGYIAKVIFAIGIIGLGLLSVPVLAGSAAYSFCSTFGLKKGLNLKFHQGKWFYGVIIATTLIGLCMNFVGMNPMKALVYAAVINGVVSVPLIFVIALIANNKKIMGGYKSKWLSNIFIWITFIAMAAAAVSMFISFWKK